MRCKHQFRRDLSETEYESDIAPLIVTEESQSLLRIRAPDEAALKRLRDTYLRGILELAEEYGGETRCYVCTDVIAFGNSDQKSEEISSSTAIGQGIESGLVLRDVYRFENYFASERSAFAVEIAKSVAQQNEVKYCPLVIRGSVGSGKTHILNAIGARALEERPGLRVLYRRSEGFVSDLARSLGLS